MIRELTQNLDIISALENEPNDESGLSAEELKAKFDESGNTIKSYINESLIPDVTGMIRSEVKGAEMNSGNLPNGGTAGQMLVKNSDADYDLSFSDVPKSADTLTNARTILTDLASNQPTAFDGSEDVSPGVTGILPLVSGGTGAMSAQSAALNLGRGLGICETASATVAKAVTLPGFTRVTGAIVGVKFANANTALNPTLNIDGTGAAAIIDCKTGANVSKSRITSTTHLFQFDGTNWVLLNSTAARVSGAVSVRSGTNTVNLGFTPSALLTQMDYTSGCYTSTFSALEIGVSQSQFCMYSPGSSEGGIYATVTPTATGFTYGIVLYTSATLRYIAFE